MQKDALTPAGQLELRKIPSVSELLTDAAKAGIFGERSEAIRSQLVREVLGDVRREVTGGSACPSKAAILARVEARVARASANDLRRVLNATGIALHTNLGRAPLPREVMEKVSALATGYCNLELDLESGKRGPRGESVGAMLRSVTGADGAAVVNNGAAAVFLAAAALAQGKEVIVSRGELVQIGGGFRVPEILAASGAVLREVGTTNITTASDYEAAVTEATGLILRIHRSNFEMTGHTESPSVDTLARLARSRQVPFAVDLGSGGFVRWHGHDVTTEPTVQDVLRAGAQLVCFSGDKLVGGPQAGLIVGDSSLVEKLTHHPVFRALRVGRLTLLALQEVLRYYVNNEHAKLASWTIIGTDEARHKERTQEFAQRLTAAGLPTAVQSGMAAVGGGAAPGREVPTSLIALRPAHLSPFLLRLRTGEPAVMTRIEDDAALLDLRTILAGEEDLLFNALKAAFASRSD